MVRLLAQSLKRPKNNLLALVRNMGPGFLVAVGFIDPGNIAAGVVAGATYGYGLLWVVAAGTALVYFLQRRAALVGLGGGTCLSEASTITGMMASAYGVGGFLHRSQHHHDRPFRVAAAAVTAVALVVVALDSDALWLMVASQAALAVLLPCTVVPLLLISRRVGRRVSLRAAEGAA